MEEAANFLQTDAKEEKRRVLYSWPAFCRDLVSGLAAGNS